VSIICAVCDYENSESSSFCAKCGENLNEEPPVDKYDSPITMLRQIGNQLADKQMNFTQEQIEEVFSDIMEISQELLDESQKDLENNLLKLEDLPPEELEELAMEIDDEKSMEIFTEFLSQFQEAQDNINQGLEVAKNAMHNMRDFSEIEANKGRVELEKAMDLLQYGLNKLEIISKSAQEKMFPEEEMEEVPVQLIENINYLENIMNITAGYMEFPSKDSLKEIIPLLDNIKENIQEVIDTPYEEEEYDTEEEEEEEEEELLEVIVEEEEQDEKLTYLENMILKTAYSKGKEEKAQPSIEDEDHEDEYYEDEYYEDDDF